ncbi:MAG: DUF362 domain-containing protein [Anaerolineales bacterium]
MERVYIARCPEYDGDLIAEKVRAATDALGIDLPQHQSVFLHPTCAWAHPRIAPLAFTDPAVIEGAAQALGSGNRLTIGTNSLPGFPTRYSYRKAGYKKLAERLDAELLAVDEAATESVQLGEQTFVDKEVALPQAALEADFLIEVPKLRGSTFVSVAGALRNHQGLLQKDAQQEGHRQFHSKVVDLITAATPDLLVVDAITAGHKGGELSGEPVDLGILIIGTNAVAVDALAATAYGVDPTGLRYLQLAAQRDHGPNDPEEIEILGDLTLEELRELSRKVERVDPDPVNYPLPSHVQVRRSEKTHLAGTAGGLTEAFLVLKRAGLDLADARETMIVIGSVGEVPRGKSERATIVLLGDTARAEYDGYSRVVRLRGRYVPLDKLLNDMAYAMKVGKLSDQLGSDMLTDSISSKVRGFFNKLSS